MLRLLAALLLVLGLPVVDGFSPFFPPRTPAAAGARLRLGWRRHRARAAADEGGWAAEDLEEHDCIEYRGPSSADVLLGVVGATGSVTPLCTWAEGSMEYVWDEDAPQVALRDAEVFNVLENVYPSVRAVGGGIGPENPHGEHSEDVYDLTDTAISDGVVRVFKPEREIFW